MNIRYHKNLGIIFFNENKDLHVTGSYKKFKSHDAYEELDERYKNDSKPFCVTEKSMEWDLVNNIVYLNTIERDVCIYTYYDYSGFDYDQITLDTRVKREVVKGAKAKRLVASALLPYAFNRLVEDLSPNLCYFTVDSDEPEARDILGFDEFLECEYCNNHNPFEEDYDESKCTCDEDNENEELKESIELRSQVIDYANEHSMTFMDSFEEVFGETVFDKEWHTDEVITDGLDGDPFV